MFVLGPTRVRSRRGLRASFLMLGLATGLRVCGLVRIDACSLDDNIPHRQEIAQGMLHVKQKVVIL